MSTARAAMVLLVLAMAGCTGDAVQHAPLAVLPSDWQAGHELEAHMTGRAHSGAYDARVFPTADAARPLQCGAYRGNATFSGDTCTIIDSRSEHWFPIDDRLWGLMGEWEGRFGDTADHPDPARPRILVAYAAEGDAVAYWDGLMHPEARHATE